jgi:enterochelin esterase-like enzyme
MNDGFAVFSPRGWNAPSTLDALIAAGRIPPVIVVGIDNAASIPGAANPGRDRAREYLPFPDPLEPDVARPLGLQYPAFVLDEVMPLINERFRTQSTPETTAIGGSSYGGIAALVTVQQRPGVFGLLMLESTPLFMFDGQLVSDTRSLNILPNAIYMGLGTAETEDVQLLKRGQMVFDDFARVVRQRAPRTRLLANLVTGGTHTSAAWGARLATALEFLYGAGSR